MGTEIFVGVASAGGGALLLFIGSLVWKWIKRRVIFSSPDRRRTDRLEARLDKMEPLLAQIADNQRPMLNGMAAVIDAVRTGVANGKLSAAGGAISERTEEFEEFLVAAAKPAERSAG